MKKTSDSRVGKVISRIFNVRAWFDWERMKVFSFYVRDSFIEVFSFKPNTLKNQDSLKLTASFDQAQQQFKLSEKDLLSRQNALLRLSLLMFIIACAIFLYAGYNFYLGHLRAGFLSLVVMFVSCALAFRYHFWYYQIKSRKLGCSMQEWFKKGLLGEKK